MDLAEPSDDIHGENLLEEAWDARHDIFSVYAENERDLPHLESYLSHTYERASFDGHLRWLMERPFLCKTVIENWLMTDAEKWDLLVNCMALPKPRIRIIYVIGEPGSGKSAFAYDLAHAIHERSGRPVVEIGDAEVRPPFVSEIERFEQAPYGAVFIDNEAAVNQGARNTTTREGKQLNPAMATIRHNDAIGIWVSQNTAMADPTLLRMAQMLVFKPMGLTQGDTERGSLRRRLAYWKELLPRDPSETFILSKHIQPMKFQRPLQEWHTDEVSASYARLDDWNEALALAIRHRGPPGYRSWPWIERRMAARSVFPLHATSWREKVLDATGGVDPATGLRPRRRAPDKPAASAKAEGSA